jgi:uncharacterized protein
VRPLARPRRGQLPSATSGARLSCAPVAAGSTERDAVRGHGIAIREGRHGRGVFATRRFAEGQAVEVCPTLPLPEAEVTGTLGDYVFKSGSEDEVLMLFGFGMLYNHSSRPNLEYFQDDPDTITFVATRAIKAGDELTIDYGSEWWELRGLEPD